MRFYGYDFAGESIHGQLGNTLIAGRGGSGKTNLAAQLALDDFADGNQVIYISFDGYMAEPYLEKIKAQFPVEKLEYFHPHHLTYSDRPFQIPVSIPDSSFYLLMLPALHSSNPVLNNLASNVLDSIRTLLTSCLNSGKPTSIYLDGLVGAGRVRMHEYLSLPIFLELLKNPLFKVNITIHTLEYLPSPSWKTFKEYTQTLVMVNPQDTDEAPLQNFSVPISEMEVYDRVIRSYPTEFHGYVWNVEETKPEWIKFPYIGDYSKVRRLSKPDENPLLKTRMIKNSLTTPKKPIYAQIFERFRRNKDPQSA